LIKEIYNTEGSSAFYKGALANLILVVNPIINFVIYERLRGLAVRHFGKDVPSGITFFLSSIGKIVATLVTYPLLTIRVRQQAAKIGAKQEPLHLKSLYRGIEAKIVQTVLYNAFLMTTFEKLRLQIKRLLVLLLSAYYKTLSA